jgi:hypothetical protein
LLYYPLLSFILPSTLYSPLLPSSLCSPLLPSSLCSPLYQHRRHANTLTFLYTDLTSLNSTPHYFGSKKHYLFLLCHNLHKPLSLSISSPSSSYPFHYLIYCALFHSILLSSPLHEMRLKSFVICLMRTVCSPLTPRNFITNHTTDQSSAEQSLPGSAVRYQCRAVQTDGTVQYSTDQYITVQYSTYEDANGYRLSTLYFNRH